MIRSATDSLVEIPRLHVQHDAAVSCSRLVGAWVLRDALAREQMVCASIDQRKWIQYPGVVTFEYNARTPETVIARSSATFDGAHELYYRECLPLLMQACGFEAQHASAVVVDGKAVAFIGESGMGKSTLAYSSAQQGFPHWADDAVMLDVLDHRVVSWSLPFHSRLRLPAAHYYGCKGHFNYEELGALADHNLSSLPCAALCVLNRSAAGHRSPIRRLSRIEAFSRLLEHAYCFNPLDRDRKREMVEKYFKIVEAIPVFEVDYQHTGLEQLAGEATRIIETVAENLCAT